MAQINIEKTLKGLVVLLKREKECLIKNDVDNLSKIIEDKNNILVVLESYKDKDERIDNNRQIEKLLKEIDSLQESNLLLTRQALSFQNTLLETIANNIEKTSKTYSQKGEYEKVSNINIVDQSV